MRIVHGVHWSTGGIVKFMNLLLSNMDNPRIEHHVIMLNYEAEPNQELRKKCMSYESLGFDKNKLGAIVLFAKLLNKIEPDIFHAHSFVPGLVGRMFCSKKTTCVTTIHNEYLHYNSDKFRDIAKLYLEYRSLKRSCSSVICVSESVRKLVAIAMPEIPLEVINNGVKLGPMRNSSKQPKKDFITIMTLGRLDEQKGYDLLIEAFAVLNKRGVNACLRIVGEGLLRPSLEMQVRKLGLEGKVFMPGFSKNPTEEFKEADIFVCSSHYEGFSLAAAEAMAFGLPLVATRIGGVVAMVRDNVEACIVPLNDPIALSNAIYVLIEDTELRHRIGNAARDFARKNFDIRNTVRRYEMLYEKLQNEEAHGS